MTTHSSPVPVGTAVIVHVVGGHASRWIDPDDPGSDASDDATPSRRACTLYKPGHQVHFIQANRALRTPSRTYTLLAVDGDELLVADEGGFEARWWVHDTDFARAALLLDERPVIDLHDVGLARIGTTLFCPYINHSRPLAPCASNPLNDLVANGGGYL